MLPKSSATPRGSFSHYKVLPYSTSRSSLKRRRLKGTLMGERLTSGSVSASVGENFIEISRAGHYSQKGGREKGGSPYGSLHKNPCTYGSPLSSHGSSGLDASRGVYLSGCRDFYAPVKKVQQDRCSSSLNIRYRMTILNKGLGGRLILGSVTSRGSC